MSKSETGVLESGFLELTPDLVENLPEGETQHKKITRGWKAPAGEAYVASETPRGEMSTYFVSDGGKSPYRVRTRGPSFYNIALLTETARGLLIGDLIMLVGSLDFTLGDCDR